MWSCFDGRAVRVSGVALGIAAALILMSCRRRAEVLKLNSEGLWINTVGMSFQPIGGGLRVSVYETRVAEFQKFVTATGREWPQPEVETTPEHPAVNVTWDDARDFCAWLTSSERGERLISDQHEYRLPTDEEWSLAAGAGSEPGHTPAERSRLPHIAYAWGSAWPPPAGSGNFAGDEAQVDPSEPGAHIAGYNDSFPRLAPVAQFPPNRFGLYDLAGNALEWCEDWFSPAQRGRVMRGGSWLNGDPASLSLHHRAEIPPRAGLDVTGFRCVLAPVRDQRLAPTR